jgi:hypothetical protein
MGSFLGGPPLPTNDPLPAPDVPAVNAYSPQTDMTDRLNFLKANSAEMAQVAKVISGVETTFGELLLFLVKIIGEAWIGLLKFLVPLQVDYNNALTALHKQELPIGIPAVRELTADTLAIILPALGSTATSNYVVPGSDITSEGEELYSNFIRPFTLWANTADPSKFGSGFQNAEFLLRRSLVLSLAEYTVDSMSNLIGFGWVKSLQPILGFIDRSINPSNIVRQSMEQAYSFLMKAPMQRDLNHLYPIKDLGVTALAKLYVRNAIDEQTYLNKCLDAGLDNTQAQQLILETAKLLSSSQLGDLLTHGFITQDDMLAQLKEQGYPEWQANAIIYLQTHSRYFSIQERVGNAAVTAWKAGKIDQSQLETLLQNLGFTSDEVNLLEIEGQFNKSTTEQKALTYSQVHQMFTANIVDLDFVIQFLTAENYAADDITRLVLLDFVTAEERALRQAELEARIRVQAEQQRALAAAEAAKNETALADARTALAKELDDVQKQLGLLQSLPSILDLIGIALP